MSLEPCNVTQHCVTVKETVPGEGKGKVYLGSRIGIPRALCHAWARAPLRLGCYGGTVSQPSTRHPRRQGCPRDRLTCLNIGQ